MISLQYFILRQDPEISNPIQILNFRANNPIGVGLRINADMLPKNQVAYYEYDPQIEISSILYTPLFLIEDQIKRLWHLYDETITFKSVQLYAQDRDVDIAPLYWCPMLEKVSCLSDKTKFYPNGAVKTPALLYHAIKDRHIFQVADTLELLVVISLPVAESLLKRGLFGFQLESVIFN